MSWTARSRCPGLGDHDGWNTQSRARAHGAEDAGLEAWAPGEADRRALRRNRAPARGTCPPKSRSVGVSAVEFGWQVPKCGSTTTVTFLGGHPKLAGCGHPDPARLGRCQRCVPASRAFGLRPSLRDPGSRTAPSASCQYGSPRLPHLPTGRRGGVSPPRQCHQLAGSRVSMTGGIGGVR